MKKFDKKKGGDQSDQEEEKFNDSGDEENALNDNELFYFSKEEKCYKVFNPRSKQWTKQQVKPSDAQIKALREIAEQLQKEEEELAKQIHHDIAGEDGEPELEKHNSSIKHQLLTEEA